MCKDPFVVRKDKAVFKDIIVISNIESPLVDLLGFDNGRMYYMLYDKPIYCLGR